MTYTLVPQEVYKTEANEDGTLTLTSPEGASGVFTQEQLNLLNATIKEVVLPHAIGGVVVTNDGQFWVRTSVHDDGHCWHLVDGRAELSTTSEEITRVGFTVLSRGAVGTVAHLLW